MMLSHNLRTDAQICGKSATQASLFVRHGRGVNRVYCASGYPRHVGRNYVPLFDVDTDLRYYVFRDVIVL